MADDNIVLTDSIQVAPFRSIHEFLLDKARFQLPTFNDLKKWNNRVVTNLLYYQTNYFAVLLTFILFSCFIHSQDVIVGISALVLVAGVLWAVFAKNEKLVQVRTNYPYIVVLLVGVVGYYFIYVLPSVVILLFALGLPVVVVFVHASVRLRSFSAKINIKMENLRLRQTVMGQVLDLIGVDIE